MARPRLLTGVLLAAGSFGASVLYRRRAVRRRARVDLYYDDGSMVSLAEGSPAAEQLLALAHELLHAVR
jgi:Zn-dependent peptidase ImmA (M78 family)